MWFLNDNFCHIHIDTKDKTARKLAQYKNAKEFQNVFALLYNETFAHIPDIEGLPDTVSQRIIKEAIIWKAGVFFFRNNGSTLSLPGLPTGDFTLYGDPAKATVYGRNGFNKTISLCIPQGGDVIARHTTNGTTVPEDGVGVWVRANSLVYPVINYIIEYADKIADSLRTLDTVRENIKRPYIVTAEESVINTVKAFFNARSNNESFIVSTGVFPADKIKLLPFETTSEQIRDVTMEIEWYMSQFRQIIGISSPSTVDKKAEITTAELNSHKGVEEIHNKMIEDILQRDLDFANEKLGLSMSLKIEEPEQPTGQEVNDDDGSNSNEEVQ